ncbi:hypothetical protein F3Y22_tig00112738pilonHSYRG00782 [Hibiscus syriacus]|uniref:Uncharacterized protein n=1 Tax=Hibiscus syriacus TaxID=106335 RepID=A0A6A2XC67_HIBSY|nr:hypothetical protein F3Y22_tig00112738pilonHSYRG00782 [Hibiscus syriacus]
MFPGQKQFDLSLFLGICVYDLGFWGYRIGIEGKGSAEETFTNGFMSNGEDKPSSSVGVEPIRQDSVVARSTKESHKWNKKRILALKKERFETQKTLLKIYFKFETENMFSLYGVEINMIALLLTILVFLSALVLILEYFAIWKSMFPLNQPIQSEIRCHDCWKNSGQLSMALLKLSF